KIGAGLVVLLILTYWFWYAPASSGTGTGEVNLFTGDSENYRVKAKIERSSDAAFMPLLFQQHKYSVESVTWPNDGTTHFTYCYLEKEGRHDCTDDEGNKYEAELEWYSEDVG